MAMIKRYCGPYLYEIQGNITKDKLMGLIAIIFAGL